MQKKTIKACSSEKLIAISRDPLVSRKSRNEAKIELKSRKIKPLRSGEYSVLSLRSKPQLRQLKTKRLRGM